MQDRRGFGGCIFFFFFILLLNSVISDAVFSKFAKSNIFLHFFQVPEI